MNKLVVSLSIGILAGLAVGLMHLLGLFVTPELTLFQAIGFKQPPLNYGWVAQVPIVLSMAALAGWICLVIPSRKRRWIVLLFGALLCYTGSWTLALYGVFISPFQSIVAIFWSALWSSLYRRSRLGKRQKLIDRLFVDRVSPGNLQLIQKSPALVFEPRQSEGSTLFVSLNHSPLLAEALSAPQYLEAVNRFLQTAGDFLIDNGAYLDECNGSGIRAVFGLPLDNSGHARSACRAALGLKTRLVELNRELDSLLQHRLDFTIGIDSGELLGGMMGRHHGARFAVTGPSAEFARQLAQAAPQYGTVILVGSETYHAAGEDLEVRPTEVVRAPNYRKRQEIFEILAPKNTLTPELETSRDHFWKGVVYFRERQWEKALKAFEAARIPGIPDPAIDFYILRLDRIRRGDEEAERRQMLLFASN